MNYRKILFVTALLALLLAAATACGGATPSIGGGSGPVSINDVPTFAGATELKPGDSTLADTLAKNTQQITAISQSAGGGGKTEQKGFTLPQDATWDAIKKFYDDKLKGSGWSEPGGVAGTVLQQMNSQNDAFQTAIYQRGNQSLTLMRIVTDQTTKEVVLIYSLTTR